MDSSASEGFDPLRMCGGKWSGLSQRKMVAQGTELGQPSQVSVLAEPKCIGEGKCWSSCSMSVTNLTEMFLTKNLFLAICVDTTTWKEGKYFSMLLLSFNFDWVFEYN